VKRRDALKAIMIGSATAGVGEARGILRAVRLPEHAAHVTEASSTAPAAAFTPKYFSRHEFAVVSRLADLIIPRDASPGALDAHVPEYIDLQVSKMPDAQTQISGGVQWLGRYCSEQFGKDFLECSSAQQTQVLDKLAEAKRVPPELEQARSFFVLVRGLTCDGFYSSKLGFQELGYKGNTFVIEWHGCTHPEHGA
jgi:gluconate 2-dehydrogenase gamma chain